ncbi:methanol O-anthraniloyltransferase-like [Chenopodium quinoa]|uniref:methanol O-anthraniloyltransferase-like n=1 Tax=Chenopodium quinoa TaxID=63459 RepID=UPI000B787C54|nr:methanol O-anthraniloyltransferase-like [Chenopodium quinoa]
MEKTIKVARQEAVVVVPANPTRRELKELSDIDDQQGLRVRPQVIMAFKANRSKAGKDPAKVIKEAIAKALVYYYPFAGRLKEGPNRKLMVDCNDEGVLFIEADANVRLEEIRTRILPPCPLLEDFLYDVPGSKGIIGCPLLLFQVTRLICGGFILGVRFNHTVCDTPGFAQLLQAMAEISRGLPRPSVMPLWKRELLAAKYPMRVTCAHLEYGQAGDINHEQQFKDGGNMVRGCFHFGPKQIRTIRNLFPPNIQHSSSTFELLCAFLWRCRTIALQPDPEEIVKFSMYISLRGKQFTPLPTGYYGNAVVCPAVATKAKDLLRENSWTYALQLVKGSKDKANEEYVRSMLDYTVSNGRPDYTEYLHWMTTNHAYIGLEKVDFGWGTPLYAGVPRPHFVQSMFTRFENDRGEMVRVVLMLLPLQTMSRLKEELRKIVGDQRESSRITHASYEIARL